MTKVTYLCIENCILLPELYYCTYKCILLPTTSCIIAILMLKKKLFKFKLNGLLKLYFINIILYHF